MPLTITDIPVLKKYQSLVEAYKRTEAQKGKIQITGGDEVLRKIIVENVSKKLVENIISSRIDVITYRELSRQDNMKKASQSKLGDISDSDTDDEPLPSSRSPSALSPRTRNLFPKDGINFNFKAYFQKQMSNELGDAVKVYDHLLSSIMKAQVIKDNISTIKSFRISLEKGSKSGFGLILNPRFSTNGMTWAMKMSYHEHGKLATQEFPIMSSGVVPDLYGLTTSKQVQSSHHHYHLPGWDGVPPIFIPSYNCHCELKTEDEHDTISTPISFLIFPVASADAMYPVLVKSIEDYSIKTMSNSKVMGGMPILNLAALQGETKTVINILAKGGNPNFRSPVSMNTALHEAIYGYHLKILSLLLDMNADQTITDCKGNTPLHLACSLGYADVVRMLLGNSKVNVSIVTKNDDGKTPLDLCSRSYVRTLIREKLHELYPNKRKAKKIASRTTSPMKKA